MTPPQPADAGPRRRPLPRRVAVVRREQLSPSMVRLVLGGPGLAGFTAPGHTDAYVKLVLQHPDAPWQRDLDLDAVREQLPAEQWPRLRTYTVRRWDAGAEELAVDVVVHGDAGLAGPWAAGADVGSEVHLLGPGGGYAPDPAAAWHLLVGDESALPAVAAASERLPAGVPAHVLVEVAGPADELAELRAAAPASADVRWLHRGERRVGAALVEAVEALPVPAGDGQAFVHGEAGFVRELRRLLRTRWAVPADRLSVSGYWRLGADDEGWRASKGRWREQVEADDAAAGLA